MIKQKSDSENPQGLCARRSGLLLRLTVTKTLKNITGDKTTNTEHVCRTDWLQVSFPSHRIASFFFFFLIIAVFLQGK